MANKRSGGSKSKRRGGTPPVHSRFQTGVCPNIYGRGGKPKPVPNMDGSTPYGRMFLANFDREIQAGGAPIAIIERMIQETAAKALQGDISLNLALQHIYSRLQMSDEAIYEEARLAYIRKLELEEDIATRCRKGKPPLDVLPHPAHVHYDGRNLTLDGPTTAWERSLWEFTKYTIHSYLDARKVVREQLAKAQDEEMREFLSAGLAFAEKIIRKFKRAVPKGWNWKERIYTVGGSQAEVDAFIASSEFKLYFNV